MRFIDEAKVIVRSGKGGNGAISFRREKFIPRGGPDGGDGGKGGDVYLVASPRLLTLYDFRHRRLHEASSGKGGMGSQMNGRSGDDLYIEVPSGTLVYQVGEKKLIGHQGYQDEEGNPVPEKPSWHEGEQVYEEEVPEGAEPHEDEIFIADLVDPEKPVRVAKGGRGGKGNLHFKTSTNRTPRFAQPGEPGEELRLRLELRIMADVGLLGLPNAGKSTFISTISAAKPKIASYPFTTLTPNLGVVQDDQGRRMVVADIPGLIEGASEGLGLGHQFLRHVERTRFLVHILSAQDLGPADSDDPWAGFSLVNTELAKFDPALALKTQVEVVNKIDLLSPEELEALEARAAAEGRKIFFISALRGDGVEELLAEMWRLYLGLSTDHPADHPADRPAQVDPSAGEDGQE